MNIEVLISTMNLENNRKLLKKMNISTPSVTINQITATNKSLINTTESDSIHRVYSYSEKGLSKSRNKAMQKSKSDICILADDDIKYVDNYQKIVQNAYNTYKNADIIAFYVGNNINKKECKRINYLSSLKIKSVQITYKREKLKKTGILFDENYGTGTKICIGEENIFLYDCLRKKLKVYYISEKIAELLPSSSSWFKGYTKNYFLVKGSAFYRMTKWFYPFLIVQFAIRKRKLYSMNLKLTDAIKYMFQGAININEGLKNDS